MCTKLERTPDFDSIFHIEDASKQLSAVSSNPTRVSLCNNDIPDCNITQYNITAYPGETFQIPAVAVGQRFGTVPYPVESRFISASSNCNSRYLKCLTREHKGLEEYVQSYHTQFCQGTRKKK